MKIGDRVWLVCPRIPEGKPGTLIDARTVQLDDDPLPFVSLVGPVSEYVTITPYYDASDFIITSVTGANVYPDPETRKDSE